MNMTRIVVFYRDRKQRVQFIMVGHHHTERLQLFCGGRDSGVSMASDRHMADLQTLHLPLCLVLI